MLLEHLTDNPGWLNRMLDFPRANEYAADEPASSSFVRRACAKLLYEIEFHQGGRSDRLFAEIRRAASDRDEDRAEPDGLSVGHGRPLLRARVPARLTLEAQLSAFLKEKFGRDWYTQRSAGSLLRELWSEGQRLTADEPCAR